MLRPLGWVGLWARSRGPVWVVRAYGVVGLWAVGAARAAGQSGANGLSVLGCRVRLAE
jgi:hypothetical protein